MASDNIVEVPFVTTDYRFDYAYYGDCTVADPGKIEGRKLYELFGSLITEKTIISIYVAGTDFQRLTCVTAVEQTKDRNLLVIDCPEGFSKATREMERLDLRFNFNGSDQLEYIFSTRGGTVHGRELKVPFPNFVERLQRRKNFRIDAIPGTRLFFTSRKVEGQMDLINISLGGVLGLLKKHGKKDLTGSLFKANQRLYKIRIVFPADNIVEAQTVNIRKAEVRRIERDKERKQYKYALEFTEIDKEELRGLTNAIYHIQRQFLQKR